MSMVMGIDSFRVGDSVTMTIRLKNDSKSQNAYNLFKNHLKESFGFTNKKGYGGRGVLVGENYIVNSIKSNSYWHLVITVKREDRKDFIKALRFFDFNKNHVINDM
jgi:hypothetical protein